MDDEDRLLKTSNSTSYTKIGTLSSGHEHFRRNTGRTFFDEIDSAWVSLGREAGSAAGTNTFTPFGGNYIYQGYDYSNGHWWDDGNASKLYSSILYDRTYGYNGAFEYKTSLNAATLGLLSKRGFLDFNIRSIGRGGSDFNFVNAFITLDIDENPVIASEVPEPSTLAMFSFGMMGLVFRRSKLKTNHKRIGNGT